MQLYERIFDNSMHYKNQEICLELFWSDDNQRSLKYLYKTYSENFRLLFLVTLPNHFLCISHIHNQKIVLVELQGQLYFVLVYGLLNRVSFISIPINFDNIFTDNYCFFVDLYKTILTSFAREYISIVFFGRIITISEPIIISFRINNSLPRTRRTFCCINCIFFSKYRTKNHISAISKRLISCLITLLIFQSVEHTLAVHDHSFVVGKIQFFQPNRNFLSSIRLLRHIKDYLFGRFYYQMRGDLY